MIEIFLGARCRSWMIFIFILVARHFYILRLRRKDLKYLEIMNVESSYQRCWIAFYLFQQWESITSIFGSKTHTFSYNLQSI